jgi:hypothetical protein
MVQLPLFHSTPSNGAPPRRSPNPYYTHTHTHTHTHTLTIPCAWPKTSARSASACTAVLLVMVVAMVGCRRAFLASSSFAGLGIPNILACQAEARLVGRRSYCVFCSICVHVFVMCVMCVCVLHVACDVRICSSGFARALVVCAVYACRPCIKFIASFVLFLMTVYVCVASVWRIDVLNL